CLRYLSIAFIRIFLFNLFFPFGTFTQCIYNMQNEKKVDVIVLYKDKVPKTPRIFGSTYENEKVLKSLPIKTMTVPISEFNRLKKEPNVLSISLDQEVELAETELKEISTQELELQRSLGEYDWNNDMIKGFDAWDDGYTGKGIDVAVFDTGFASHSDISYAGGHSVFEDESWSVDHNGHGTHV